MTYPLAVCRWQYVCFCFLFLCTQSGCDVPELEQPSQALPVTPAPNAQAATTSEPQQASVSQGQQPAGNASETAPASESIDSRRGLALEDWPDGFVYILVKDDAGKVAEAIATKYNGRSAPSKIGEPIDPEKLRTIVGQFKGHAWSHLTWFDQEPESLVAELSRQLATDAIMVSYSDFSGWQFVDVYRNGENIEAMHWGLDYSDELGSPDLSEWDTQSKVTTRDDDGFDMTDQFLFRSKLRKVSEAELSKGDAFADWLLREYDAYLPDTGMVWFGEGNAVNSPLGQDAFSSIHVVVDGQ